MQYAFNSEVSSHYSNYYMGYKRLTFNCQQYQIAMPDPNLHKLRSL